MSTEFPDYMAVVDAREKLRTLAAEGHECPVCEQHVKVYRRPLTAVSARAVVALYREHHREYGHMPEVAQKYLPEHATQGGYLTLAHHWDLIEPQPLQQRGRPGMWRVTGMGVDWLNGDLTVPSHVLLYNNRPLGYEGEPVSVSHVLGRRFELGAVLSAVPDDVPSLLKAAA
jgi:hypothetical protein